MLVRAKSVPRACNLESNRMGEAPVRNYMYLKKISTNEGLVVYHCKSKSQAKRWLRSQRLTQPAISVSEDSFAFITPGDPSNYARLFWQEGIFQNSCWVLHHLPPGV